jgi:subtilisin family serine protease
LQLEESSTKFKFSKRNIVRPLKGELRKMKKELLICIVLLSMLVLTMVPMTRSTSPPPNFKFTATPVETQFEEAADLTNTADPFGTYVPYDVDMVNGELYPNGGQGIYVAIIDTGLVYNWKSFLPPTATVREDLGRGWSYNITWNGNGFDFTPWTNRGFITKKYEGDGHGTHVASRIVGYYRAPVGYPPFIVEGVAPKATIIPLLGLDTWLVNCPDPNYPGCHAGKVLFRGGDDWMLTSAIYYVASLAETNGWKIICTNSWGSSEPSPAIQTAIDYAISKGVIFTFAAGNRGDAQMDWPGAYPEVISCAAGGWTMQVLGSGTSNPPAPYRWYLSDVPEKLNTNDALGNNWEMFLTTFSGRPNAALGQSWKDVDVCAPGSYVVGPYKPEAAWSGTAWVNLNAPTAYYGLWGTSMATPHVAGVAAIVAQYYPSLNQADMEWILQKAASRIPLSSNTKYAYDPFYDPNYPNAPGPFDSQHHDGGRGWLTADAALDVAAHY